MCESLFYIGRNTDENIVKQSSSGGIMSVVAEWIFKRGGIVFGASYVEGCNKVEHIKVECFEELYRLRKSIYVWSDYKVCLDEMKKQLEDKKNVLFIGTPCQCLVVNHRFSMFTNLFLLDFFCHGALETKYLSDYIDGINEPIKKVDFREESRLVKDNFIFSVVDYEQNEIIHDDYNNNVLTNLFVSSAGLRRTCFNCSICTKKHVSNITIGDVQFDSMAFRHGFNKYHLSIIAVNDKKGKKIMEESNEYIDLAKLDSRDKEEIEFYYQPHKNSGMPWEYDWKLRCWFEDTYNACGFEEAAYRCMHIADLKLLEQSKRSVKGKNIYLYGCGKKGRIFKELIDKYFSYWNLVGYIVTNRSEKEVNGLNVYQFDQFEMDFNRDFIIVSIEKKKEIYSILENAGLKKGIDFI